MSSQFEGVPMYRVAAYAKRGGLDFRDFDGARAYSEASDFYEAMKAHPDAYCIWFTRMDGGNPVFVVPIIKRNAAGAWVDEKEVVEPEEDE